MATKETMAVIEQTIDTIEDTFDTIERIPRVNLNGTTKKQQIIILSVTVVVSAISGGGLVYFLFNKKIQTKYEKIANAEIAEARKFYIKRYKKDEFSDPVTLLESHAGEISEEIINTNKYRSVQMHPSLEPVIDDGSPEAARLIKRGKKLARTLEPPINQPVFDYDEEMKIRSEHTAYVISHDEFYQGEKDYPQITVSYFEGDDVLIDERDEPINDVESTIGVANLERFGHGSNDNNVVHIRNERLEVDFEVVRSHGKYVEEILGFIKHSQDSRKVRRFRSDDG